MLDGLASSDALQVLGLGASLGATGLVAGDLLSAGAGHHLDELAGFVQEAQRGLADLDGGEGMPVRETDLDALVDDLDAAASGPAAAPAPARRMALASARMRGRRAAPTVSPAER
jgi:hypothetical protein